MLRIRQNVLEYSVEEYRTTMRENIQMLEDTKKKFREYEELVKTRVHDLEEQNINVKKLSKKDQDNYLQWQSFRIFPCSMSVIS
jgi:uncharacterized protein HemX